MKIAIATEDGETVSQHFGRAPYYAVLSVEEGRVVARELREKVGHAQFGGEAHAESCHSEAGHGFDSESQGRHARTAASITDCQVLLVRGMGAGAYQSLMAAGVRPVITDVREIDKAVQAYLAGTLVDYTERLH